MAKSVTDIAAKWKQNVAAAGGKWNNGIQQYAGNPMQAAAAQADKAVANYGAAKDRMVAGLNNTPVSFWKSQAAASQANYTQGATKGSPKYTKAIQVLSSQVWPAMKQASIAAGGGPAGAAAAVQALMDAKRNGQTK
jgi:hypothetical protein